MSLLFSFSSAHGVCSRPDTLFRILVGFDEECIFSLEYLIPFFWSFTLLDMYMGRREREEGVGDGLSSILCTGWLFKAFVSWGVLFFNL